MGRFKPVDYAQDLLLSVSLDKQIVPGSMDWAIHHLIEHRIDLSSLTSRYKNDETGRPAYDPRVLLKVILAGYARGVLSSRRLEMLCRENVVFMALTCGAIPDHSTIATFVSQMGDAVHEIFQHILLICEEEGLLGGTHLSIDGTKMSSSASKEWSGTHQELADKRDRIYRLIAELIAAHRRNDRGEPGDDARRDQQRIEKLQRSAERIDEFLNNNQPRIGTQGKEIKSNITDPESAKLSHSGGVQQGYNANAVVDEQEQIIVAAEAFGQATDHNNLPSLLEQTADHLSAIGHVGQLDGITLSADTSYFSHVNLQACEDHQLDAYIPDPLFRSRDPRLMNRKKYRKKTLTRPERKPKPHTQYQAADFIYDQTHGTLTCPAGEQLMSDGKNVKMQGNLYHSFIGRPETCGACQQRERCIKRKHTKARRVNIKKRALTFDELSSPTLMDRMKNKIDSIKGRLTYSKRMGIVEPVFANMATHKGMQKFTLRGKAKVNIQWILYCIVHNISKIANKGTAIA